MGISLGTSVLYEHFSIRWHNKITGPCVKNPIKPTIIALQRQAMLLREQSATDEIKIESQGQSDNP